MTIHHDNHHRPFTSYVVDGDVVPTGFSTTVAASAVNGGLVEAGGIGIVGDKRRHLPLLQQTHHHQAFQTSNPSNTASSTSGMGYPFTQAQWRELERQAMIYKYMVASVPVPPHLLFSVSSLPGASQYSLAGGGYALRFGNGDPEPGRCRRTDGKKWRCSRDAAPDQKYCERHLNRGRPRSRKPVELSASVSPSKKTRHYHGNNAPLPSSGPAGGYNTTTSHRNNQAPVFLQRNGGLDAISDAPNKEPRGGLDWLMIGEPHISDETLSLNSNYNTYRGNQFNESLFPLGNSDIISLAEPRSMVPRGFIDAWSDHNSKHNSSFSPHDDKLSISEEMDHIQMGLGVTHWTRTGDTRPSSWISSAPGGPLAEVFRPATNVSCPSSPNSGSPLISSPSGVLQRKMASVSDSSGGSSPTLGNSMGRSEITVQWFNPN